MVKIGNTLSILETRKGGEHGKVENTAVGHAVSRGIRMKTYPYEQIILALNRFFSKKLLDCDE